MGKKEVDIEKIKANLVVLKDHLVYMEKIYEADGVINEYEKIALATANKKIKLVEAKIEEIEIENTPLFDPKLKATRGPFGLNIGADGADVEFTKSFDMGKKIWDLPIRSPLPTVDFGLTATFDPKLEFKGSFGYSSKQSFFLKGEITTSLTGEVGGYITDKLHLVKVALGIKLETSLKKTLSLDAKEGFTFIPIDVNVKASVGFSIGEGNAITEWNNIVGEELKIDFPRFELTLGEIELLFFRLTISTKNIRDSTISDYGLGNGVKKIQKGIGEICEELEKKYDDAIASLVDSVDLDELDEALESYLNKTSDFISDASNIWNEFIDSEESSAKKKIYTEACEAYVKDAMRKDVKLAMEYTSKTNAEKKDFLENIIAKLPLVEKLYKELFDEETSDEITEKALNTANALAASYSIKIVNKKKQIKIGQKYQFEVHYISDRDFQADSIEVELKCMEVSVPGLTFSPTSESDSEDSWIDEGTFIETCTVTITNEFITEILKKHQCDLDDLFLTVNVKVDLEGNAKDAFQQIQIPIT